MIPVTVAEAGVLLGAELSGTASDAVITGMAADSRSVGTGDLFVALPGEHADGHTFVPAAFGRGAAAALTAREVPGYGPCLVVADPLAALGRLARHQVDLGVAGGLRVAAVTGSQGKTSTKDLLAQVLESAGPTVAPYGNLNNELGLPLTVARIDLQTRFLVAEMGARGVGHIAYLCSIAPPQVAAVLNVGHAHVGEFGGRSAIAQAKGELVEALASDGVAVLNADDPLVWPMRERTSARVVGFGVGSRPPGQDSVWATGVVPDDLGRCRFVLHASAGSLSGSVPVRLAVSGQHQVANAVAAAAMALGLGVDLKTAGTALATAGPRSRWRMELSERADKVVVINDAYNANPESMRSALETLVEIGRRREGSTTWAVLGDMLELGAAAPEQHRALGRLVADLGVRHLVALGAHAGDLVAGATEAGAGLVDAAVAADKASAARAVVEALAPGDVVLVKASRGLALDTVATAIAGADPLADPPDRREDSA